MQENKKKTRNSQKTRKGRSGFWRAGTTPILEKTLRECMGQMKILHAGSHQFRESLRELLRELWLSLDCSSRETPFREWDSHAENYSFELRELLREYPGTLPELREWPFRSESLLPEVGVAPRPAIISPQTQKLVLTTLPVLPFLGFLDFLG